MTRITASPQCRTCGGACKATHRSHFSAGGILFSIFLWFPLLGLLWLAAGGAILAAIPNEDAKGLAAVVVAILYLWGGFSSWRKRELLWVCSSCRSAFPRA